LTNNPNILVQKRLQIIEKRISSIAFLNAHLKQFSEDDKAIDEKPRFFSGLYLFYYYSFSQFILEINKLFDFSSDEYYSIPKLLNHIDSNIKSIEWYKTKTISVNAIEKDSNSGKLVLKSGEKTEWQEVARNNELKEKKEMIAELKSSINEHKENIHKIQTIRNKFIAHLDKNFQDYNLNIPTEMADELFTLAYKVFNKVNQEIRGRTLGIDFIQQSTHSTLIPIKQYYKIRTHILLASNNPKKSIDIEYLKESIR